MKISKHIALLSSYLILFHANATSLDSGYIILNQLDNTRHSMWTTDTVKNILSKDTSSNYTAAISGDVFNWDYNITHQHISNNGKTTIDKLYRTFDINDNLTIKIGKFVENWQIGYAFNPLGITDPYYDSRSLGTLPIKQTGINAITMSYHFDDGDSVYLYQGSDTNDYDPIKGYGYRGSAIRFHHIFSNDTDISFMMHKKPGVSIGLGTGVRSIIGDNAQVYAAMFARQGTTKGVHLGVLEHNANFIARSNPIGEHRKNQSQYYPRILLGMQYTTDSDLDIIIELNYDKRNMDKKQWDTYKSLVANHQLLTGVARANLAWDLSLTNSPTGLRQYHLFTRLRQTLGQYQLGFSRITSQDLSALNQVELSYDWSDDLIISGLFSKTTGNNNTEYNTYFPYKQQLSLNILYNF